MNTMDIGLLSELIVKQRFIENGWNVFVPLSIQPYDILVEKDAKYAKIQIKTGNRNEEGILKAYTCRANGASFTPYSTEEVDFFAVVDQVNKQTYLIDAKGRVGKNGKIKTGLRLRLDEPKIKSPTVIYAKSYQF